MAQPIQPSLPQRTAIADPLLPGTETRRDKLVNIEIQDSPSASLRLFLNATPFLLLLAVWIFLTILKFPNGPGKAFCVDPARHTSISGRVPDQIPHRTRIVSAGAAPTSFPSFSNRCGRRIAHYCNALHPQRPVRSLHLRSPHDCRLFLSFEPPNPKRLRRWTRPSSPYSRMPGRPDFIGPRPTTEHRGAVAKC